MVVRLSCRVTEKMVPFGVVTGCGGVGSPKTTLESSVNSLVLFILLQVMVGPGMPVAVHSNVAVIPSLTVTTVSNPGSVISGTTGNSDTQILCTM